MTPWITAKSDAIRAYAYSVEDKRLRVRFRSGRIYDYRDVGTRLFAQFVTSDAQGTFLNQQIKPNHHYEPVHRFSA